MGMFYLLQGKVASDDMAHLEPLAFEVAKFERVSD